MRVAADDLADALIRRARWEWVKGLVSWGPRREFQFRLVTNLRRAARALAAGKATLVPGAVADVCLNPACARYAEEGQPHCPHEERAAAETANS